MSNKRRRVDNVDRLILLANEKTVVASVAELQGRRNSMEDTHINCQLNGNVKLRLFGVCDGHGGALCSQFVKENLGKWIIQSFGTDVDCSNLESVRTAIHLAFAKCEAEFESKYPNDFSGSTCCLVLYFEEKGIFYIANCGDSRAIVFSDISIDANSGKLVTTDHKPDLPTEKRRIESKGGTVVAFPYYKNGKTEYVHRVNGILAVARSFGDQQLRPFLTEVPDVYGPFPISCRQNSAVLLACDGAFECNTSEELCENVSSTVTKCFREETLTRNTLTRSKEKVAAEGRRALAITNGVLNYAYTKGSEDNITAVFIQFLE